MKEDLSLFSAEEEEVGQEMMDKQLQQTMSGLIANRSTAMQKYSQDTSSVSPLEESASDTPKEATYTKEEIFQEVVSYFGGDELAAGVWIDKYALKNADGELVERTPEDMHRRMAREFARIERRYANPMSEDEIFGLFDHFKYVIPQGSPMAGIGNKYQVVSLSNCFVIGNSGNADSYGGIMKMDEEQVQLMKRRGGVGHDMSDIRPAGSHVQNCAQTSTGIVPFMERFSNSTREVAQDGRRGALMLSISIKHPDAEQFIDAKMTQGKVTGANVSVRVDDEFMRSVQNHTSYTQQYHVMPHTAATLHQLHLLLVNAQNGTIRVGITVESNHEAIAQ